MEEENKNINENKDINAFAELIILEENEKGLDFSTMEDGKKTIITNEESVDNKDNRKLAWRY